MSKTKENFAVELREFTELSRSHYNSYAYSSGFYESMIAEMLAEMPKSKRDHFIGVIRTSAEFVRERIEQKAKKCSNPATEVLVDDLAR